MLNFSEKTYEDLELLMNIMYTKEDSILPVSSSTFGAELFFRKKMQTFNTTDFYKSKQLDLDKLYDQGRMYNCVSDTTHVDEDRFDKYYIYMLIDDTLCEEEELRKLYWGMSKFVGERFFYEACSYHIYLTTMITNDEGRKMNLFEYFKCDYKKYNPYIRNLDVFK